METTVIRKQTTFRLDAELISKLKKAAAMANLSMNNYVESLLKDTMLYIPNDETIEAINESRSGKYAGTVDTTDMDSFKKSLGL